MIQAIAKSRFTRTAPALAATLLAALALGGCQSPMYSGTPDDMSAVSPSYQERSYVGRNEQAGEQQRAPAEETWTAEQKYEYRGGRDPVSGRANTQL